MKKQSINYLLSTILASLVIVILSVYSVSASTTIGPDISTGNIIVSGNVTTTSINLPATIDDLTGIIYKDGVRFIHDFQPVGGDGYNFFAGYEAGSFSISTSTHTYDGSWNTGVGTWALASLTYGSQNVSVGEESMYSNTSGSENTAVGVYSLDGNLGGNRNSAFGLSSLDGNISGNNNTGVGYNAGRINTTGSGLTFLGYNAGYTGSSNGLSNATAIGYEAQVTASSTLILGGTGANAVKVGVGITAPQTTFHITGATTPTLRIGGPTIAGCIELLDSLGNGTINYITISAGILSATTTKPAVCE